MLLLALLAACRSGPVDVKQDDSGPDVIWDTGAADDTADTDRPDDTHDTGATDDTGAAASSTLAAHPDGLVVHPGAAWRLRLVAVADDGTWADVEGAWVSSDDGVVSVSGDVATAVSAGDVTLTGTFDSQSADASVEVRDDGLITVTVVDAETGDVVPGASLVIDDGDRVTDDDEDGVVSTSVDSGGPLAVTVYARDHWAATAWATVSRSLTIPIRPSSTEEDASFSGDVNLAYVPEGGFGDIIVGLAAPSLQGPPLLVNPDDLLAPDRTLTIFGIETEVPANLYVRGVAEDYEAPARPGAAALWTLAGPVPITDLTDGLSGTGDALALIRENLDGMVWTWDAGATLDAGETATVDLAPSEPFDQTLFVTVGDLPLGFSGDEDPLVLVGAALDDEGLVVTGLGLGTGDVAVSMVDSAPPGAATALAIAQVDGLGSGGAICAAVAPLTELGAVMPDFLPVPDLASFDGATHDFAVSIDPSAHLVAVTIIGGDGRERDLFSDSGDLSGNLPEAGLPFSYGRTTWTLLALDAPDDTFEGYLGRGTLNLDDIAQGARSAARVTQRF